MGDGDSTPPAVSRASLIMPVHVTRFDGEGVRRGPAARMGADNEAVLTGEGRLSPDEVREMAEAGVIGDRPLDGVADRPRPLDIEAGVRRLALAGHDPDYNAVVASLYAETCS